MRNIIALLTFFFIAINLYAQDDSVRLSYDIEDVVIQKSRIKYSRKDNPAVELMRRVIAANKAVNLKSNDHYEYNNYQKQTIALNNVSQSLVDSLRQANKREWFYDQVEYCPLNDTLILPVQVNEKVARVIYSKEADTERNIILGTNSKGVANVSSSVGDYVTSVAQDAFVDVNIFDDQVRLLRKRFVSPIGKDAISFYHFYITDTLMVYTSRCIKVFFTPNNSLDIGFSGNLYVLCDSTLRIRRAKLKLPHVTGVNFIENMIVEQEFVRLPDGQWVLDTDNMLVEMYVNKLFKNAVVIRQTKRTAYSFAPLPKTLFRGKGQTEKPEEAYERGEDFWKQFRTVELTSSEKKVDGFVAKLLKNRWLKFVVPVAKLFTENYLETSFRDSVPSKIDIGPINTLVGRNIVDGWRARLSMRTTKALMNRLYLVGHIAYGFDSKNIYYGAKATYSFRHINEQPWEFPLNQIEVESTRDIISPSDKFLGTNKDNWFTAFHVKKVDKMYLYNQQRISYKMETNRGWGITIGAKAEEIEGAAAMTFYDMAGERVRSIRTTDLQFSVRYAPNESYVNTKQRRYVINYDAPVLSLSHTASFRGILGGQYISNYTELSFTKRFWPSGCGKIDLYLAATAQWNKVPFPLLIMPRTNLSYLSQHHTHTFQLMDNLEFLNDRTLQWQLQWNLGGKLFNRIPGINKLKWREVFIVRGMMGHLTDKNNPFLEANRNDAMLMQFPNGSTTMTYVPYVEGLIGIHNIFKFFEVDYVHRFTYRDLPTAMKWGIRLALNFDF